MERNVTEADFWFVTRKVYFRTALKQEDDGQEYKYRKNKKICADGLAVGIGLGRRPGRRHSVELCRFNDCADGLGYADGYAVSMPTAKLVPTVAVGTG
jgi:hypothetical protein